MTFTFVVDEENKQQHTSINMYGAKRRPTIDEPLQQVNEDDEIRRGDYLSDEENKTGGGKPSRKNFLGSVRL